MPRVPTAIGIDIGGRTLELVALAADKAGPQLVAALSRELDANRSYTRDELVAEIQSLYAAAGMDSAVVLAVGGTVATVQTLTFPKTAESQLRRMVAVETQRLAGLSPEEMVHDFIALPSDKTTDQKVLVGLCRASAIHQQLTLASQAGVEVEDVTIATVALFNAFAFSDAATKDKITALIEIGRDATNVAIVVDGGVQFVRSFPTGGNAFTSAVAEAEQLDFVEADRWKTEHGVIPETETPQGPFARRQTALYHAAETWLKELNTTLAYFFSVRAMLTHQMDRFILCGGGSSLRGLISFAEKRLGKPVKLGLPLTVFPTVPPPKDLPKGMVSADPTDPRFAIALGLAIQGLGQAAEPLSLLPAQVRAARISPVEGKKWVIASALAAGVMLTATLWAGTDFWLQGRRLRDQQASLKRKEALSGSIENEKKKRLESERLMAPIVNTGNRGQVYVEILQVLAQTKQPNDWLSLVADEESYFSQKQAGNSTQVPRLLADSSGSKSGPPAAIPSASGSEAQPLKVPSDSSGSRSGPSGAVPPASGSEEQPLKKLIVEGYTQSPNFATVDNFCRQLEKLHLGERYFQKVDTLPSDQRVADAKKDAIWEPYHMTRFTLLLTLDETDIRAPAHSTSTPAQKKQSTRQGGFSTSPKAATTRK